MKIAWKILLCLIFAMAATPAFAQSSSLSGQITDANGAVIPGTQVKAIAKDNTEFKSLADSYGVYALKMPGGSYRIEFTFPGCKNFVIPEYVLDKDTNARLDAEIPVANCTAADKEADKDAAKDANITERSLVMLPQVSPVPESKFIDTPFRRKKSSRHTKKP